MYAMKGRHLYCSLRLLGFLCATLVILLVSVKGSSTKTAYGQNENRQLIVQCDIKYAISVCDEQIAAAGGKVTKWLLPLRLAFVTADITKENVQSSSVRQALNKSSFFQSVEYDEVVFGVGTLSSPRSGTVPDPPGILPEPIWVNDPDFNDPARVYAPQLIQAPLAWLYTQGDPRVVIAVLDTGVNATHPDIEGQVLPIGYDFVNNDPDPNDDHGHGTHIAGIIAALSNNSQGIVGMCPGCKILPVKVLGANNIGSWSSVIEGILFAVENGADVINLSLGSMTEKQAVKAAIDYARSQDVLIVAAAGNSRTDAPFYPAAFEGVLGVGATKIDDTIWSLSNYGDYIDLVAPGATVYSTYHDVTNYYSGYTFMSGTSMAAPHVAGVAALLLSQSMTRTSDRVIEILAASAVDLGYPGHDDIFGQGRIDAWAALNLDPPTPLNSIRIGGKIWFDADQNGQYEMSVDQAVPMDITIEVSNSISSDTIHVSPGSLDWQIAHLYPGMYTVCGLETDDVAYSTPRCIQVQVAADTTLNMLDFGVYYRGRIPEVDTYQSFLAYISNR